MVRTASSGCARPSSQSPFTMCTLPQMLFSQSYVSCAAVTLGYHHQMVSCLFGAY